MTRELNSRPSSASGAAVSTPPLSYREFLESDLENPHVEWVNGEVTPMAPASNDHQDLVLFLSSLLRFFSESGDLGVVRQDPFQMKTGPQLPGRAPDILFVSRRRLSRLKTNHLEGAADLVVEVISPASRALDRGDKHYEYERGGVREYWLIDPPRRQAEFYLLGRDGIYKPAELDDARLFHSVVLKGLWIKPAWLWQRPLPPLMQILREWKIV